MISMQGSDHEHKWEMVASGKVSNDIAVINRKPQLAPGLVVVAKKWFPSPDAWEQACQLDKYSIGNLGHLRCQPPLM